MEITNAKQIVNNFAFYLMEQDGVSYDWALQYIKDELDAFDDDFIAAYKLAFGN